MGKVISRFAAGLWSSSEPSG